MNAGGRPVAAAHRRPPPRRRSRVSTEPPIKRYHVPGHHFPLRRLDQMCPQMISEPGFDRLKARIEKSILLHPAITDNAYCQWFRDADISHEEVRAFAQQFSVFSNLSNLALLNRVIHAGSLESAREAKEILLNELGVLYRKSGETAPVDPAHMPTEGSVECGTFRFQAAHYEWLLGFGAGLGLQFKEMGTRRQGTVETLSFCDALFRLFGSEDYSVAQGASFAIENWAASGFYTDLVAGLTRFKAARCPDLPLGFFTWHEKIEAQHKEHTWDELRETFRQPEFNEERFIGAAMTMLDHTGAFCDGLMKQRDEIAARAASTR